ncbi:unnamed protein product, partial [Rotaria socialis]
TTTAATTTTTTAAFFNQFSLNDSKPEQSSFMIKEEHISSSNPTIKLVSPFSIQTTVSNTDIDQTIVVVAAVVVVVVVVVV